MARCWMYDDNGFFMGYCMTNVGLVGKNGYRLSMYYTPITSKICISLTCSAMQDMMYYPTRLTW